jgi:hypothetical protein
MCSMDLVWMCVLGFIAGMVVGALLKGWEHLNAMKALIRLQEETERAQVRALNALAKAESMMARGEMCDGRPRL